MSDGSVRYKFDQKKWNEWDRWYIRTYLTDYDVDPEEQYQI